MASGMGDHGSVEANARVVSSVPLMSPEGIGGQRRVVDRRGDHESGRRADHHGIDERLEQADEPLARRLWRPRRGVGDGGAAQPRLVGEDGPPEPDDKRAERTPGRSGGGERPVPDRGDRTRQPVGALLHESELARTMPTARILTCRCDMTRVGRARSSD